MAVKSKQDNAEMETDVIISDSVPDVTEKPVKEAEKKKTYKVRNNLDPDMVIPVKNGFQGKLVYKSKKTGETLVWERFNDEQDMTVAELRQARNSSRAFFMNNWFLLDDREVIEYLGVENYYKNALTSASFDELFGKSADEIKDIIALLSPGQKRSITYRAKTLISDGVIDSLKVIDALEQALGIELIER